MLKAPIQGIHLTSGHCLLEPRVIYLYLSDAFPRKTAEFIPDSQIQDDECIQCSLCHALFAQTLSGPLHFESVFSALLLIDFSPYLCFLR